MEREQQVEGDGEEQWDRTVRGRLGSLGLVLTMVVESGPATMTDSLMGGACFEGGCGCVELASWRGKVERRERVGGCCRDGELRKELWELWWVRIGRGEEERVGRWICFTGLLAGQ
jgi:hypothetical protein